MPVQLGSGADLNESGAMERDRRAGRTPASLLDSTSRTRSASAQASTLQHNLWGSSP